jgi:peptidase M28-like protein
MQKTVEIASQTSPVATISKRDWGFSLSLFMLAILYALLAIYLHTPPHAQPVDAPAGEFSSARAMKDLREIAQKPHPIGALEHVKVRNYILNELTAMGVEAQVQEATVVSPQGSSFTAGTVRNLIARLHGSASTKAVLLAGHYDSVTTGPGCNDDGSAVVTLLETLRALKAGPPLNNDVIFLFTDGEEIGLLGARAFVDEHPWARDAGVVLNFEARGYSGPAIMFQTSSQNGWLIGEFGQAAPYPVASSFTYEVYKHMPNDTDLTIFQRAGYSGLNFAYIDGLSQYHTALDNFDNAGEKSIQHQGSYALALAKHFGNLNLENTKQGDAVYFDLLGFTLIHYSARLVLPIALLVTAAFAGIAILGFRKRKLSFPGILLGFAAFLSSLMGSALIITMAWWLIRVLRSEYRSMPWGEPFNSSLFLMGFVSLAIAISLALFVLYLKKITAHNLAAGALLLWLALAIASSLLAPGISYLFAWPLLFALISQGFILFGNQRSTSLLALIYLCALPGLTLLAPVIFLTFPALPLSLSAVVITLVGLLLGLLIPHFSFASSSKKWLLPAGFAIIGMVLIVAAIVTGGLSKAHPETTQLFYALNGDTGKADWVSGDDRLNAWTSQFFSANAQRQYLPDFFPLSHKKFLKQETTPLALAPPSVALTGDEVSNGTRTLRLRVTSPRQAPFISLQLGSGTELQAVAVNGKRTEFANAPRAGNNSYPWGLRYYALPNEGIELTLEVKATGPVNLLAVDQSYGLPKLPGTSYGVRPDYLTAAPLALSDSTFVSKAYIF